MHRILRLFGKARRPLAWVCLVGGLVTMVLVLAKVIAQEEPWIAGVGALLLFLDGWDKVADVEQDVDSPAAVDESDG